MNLASRCRKAIEQVAKLKQELSKSQARWNEREEKKEEEREIGRTLRVTTALPTPPKVPLVTPSTPVDSDDFLEDLSDNEDDEVDEIFPLTASPQKRKVREKAEEERFPGDIRPSRDSPMLVNQDQSTISSIDAFEASFQADFGSFEVAANEESPARSSDYNPFFPSPTKESSSDGSSHSTQSIDPPGKRQTPLMAAASRRARTPAKKRPTLASPEAGNKIQNSPERNPKSSNVDHKSGLTRRAVEAREAHAKRSSSSRFQVLTKGGEFDQQTVAGTGSAIATDGQKQSLRILDDTTQTIQKIVAKTAVAPDDDSPRGLQKKNGGAEGKPDGPPPKTVDGTPVVPKSTVRVKTNIRPSIIQKAIDTGEIKSPVLSKNQSPMGTSSTPETRRSYASNGSPRSPEHRSQPAIPSTTCSPIVSAKIESDESPSPPSLEKPILSNTKAPMAKAHIVNSSAAGPIITRRSPSPVTPESSTPPTSKEMYQHSLPSKSTSDGRLGQDQRNGYEAARARYKRALAAPKVESSSFDDDFESPRTVRERTQLSPNSYQSRIAASPLVDEDDGDIPMVSSLSASRTSRRNVAAPTSYAEPSLQSKLRRGDVYFPKERTSVKD